MQSVNISQLKSTPDTARAITLFRNGLVSAGFAARIAGKPLAEMLSLLSSMGIALTTDNSSATAEVRDDLRTAQEWLTER